MAECAPLPRTPSLVVLGLVGLLAWTGDPAFGRFLGPLPPVWVFAGIAALGGILFATVLAHPGFAVVRRGAVGGWLWASAAAAAFGTIIVTPDLFTTVVYDDAALSQIAAAQKRRGHPSHGVRYGAVDFAAVAAAFGRVGAACGDDGRARRRRA